jgi:hypothetical protein
MHMDPHTSLLLWQRRRSEEERRLLPPASAPGHGTFDETPPSNRWSRCHDGRTASPDCRRLQGGEAVSDPGFPSSVATPRAWFADHLAGAVPGYANGGVVAGTLASYLDVEDDRPVEVRLRRPIPLERELTVLLDGATAALHDGSDVLATAHHGGEVAAVRGPVAAEAARASRPVVPVGDHPAPGCFVCGPANVRGLNLQPGAVDGTDLVATTWSPPAQLGGAGGQLPAAMVWAALDCPSWYGAARGAPALLGTITAHCVRPLGVDVPVVVSGWGVRRDGRKTMAGSAIHSVDGEPLALAAATWIHPREHAR